jgi:hypothetical protein
MEWLRRLLGEDKYNKLVENGTIEILKASLGDKEYLENDPTKIVPKHVFNEKLSENKLLKTEVEQYKTQLGSIGDMVTSKDMQTKLAEQKIEFETKLAEQRNEYEKQIETTNKNNLIRNDLLAEGADPVFVDMLLKSINPDEVIVKDDKILNKDNIILPLKDTFKKVFEVKVTGTTPPANNGTPPPQPTTKQELITKYNEAEKSGDFMALQRIQREIQSIKE